MSCHRLSYHWFSSRHFSGYGAIELDEELDDELIDDELVDEELSEDEELDIDELDEEYSSPSLSDRYDSSIPKMVGLFPTPGLGSAPSFAIRSNVTPIKSCSDI